MRSITITQHQIADIKNTADKTDEEVCAFMLGNKNSVENILWVENQYHSPTFFQPSDKDIINVYNHASENNMMIVGIFHSHPKGFSTPSSTDSEWMDYNPYVWVIYSRTKDGLRAFVKDNKIISEIPIRVK